MLNYLDLGPYRLHDAADESVPRAIRSCPGLVGVPGIRGDSTDEPEGHGSRPPQRSFMPKRTVPLEVELWGSPVGASLSGAWLDFQAIVQYLLANLNADLDVGIRLEGDARDLVGKARLAGAVLPPLQGSGEYLTVQIPLRFDDPMWYAPAAHAESVGAPTSSGGTPIPIVFPVPFGEGAVGGALSIANVGNADAYPIIRINGPARGPRITDTTGGQVLDFQGLVLGTSDTLVVDCRARTATVAGFNVRGTLKSGSRFPVVPGGEVHVFTWQAVSGGTTAGSTLTVELTDTYVA